MAGHYNKKLAKRKLSVEHHNIMRILGILTRLYTIFSIASNSFALFFSISLFLLSKTAFQSRDTTSSLFTKYTCAPSYDGKTNLFLFKGSDRRENN
jgi:hypothetical protein